MTDVIAAIAIMSVSAYVGVQIKMFYKMRVRLSEDIIGLLRTIKSEIGTNRTKKDEIITNYSYNLEETKRLIGDGDCTSIYFDEEFILYVRGYFAELGKRPLDEEINKCDRAIEYLEGRCSIYRLDLSKKGNLYFKLSVLIGIAIGIMIV